MLRLKIIVVFLTVACLAHGQDGASSRQQPPPLPPGAITLKAEEQEQIEKGHVKAAGYVDIVSGNIRLSADKVDFWNEEMRVVAEGNVVFQQGDQKIVGDRMEVDLEKGTGRFYNAYGSAGTDLYFQGDVVEKVSEDVYVVERGAFTSCAQPTPRWRFTSGKATIRRDHHVSMHGTFLKVKSVPVFYLPYMYYPIDEKNRSTGLLLPEIGNSTFKGFMVSQGFFWAINRSHDATINVDWFSESGVGVGSEYRYVLSGRSRGRLESYFLNDKVVEQNEWQIKANVNQQLPAGFSTISRVDYFSSFAFQQRFQESYEAATRRSKRATINVARSWSTYTVRFLYDRNETSFPTGISFREIFPRLAFDSRQTKIGPTPILFGFRTSASQFSRSARKDRLDYQRFDVLPTLSYPFTRWPFLTARTTFITRFTHYTEQSNGAGDPVGDALDRTYSEIRVDVRGPTFSRIFNTPGNGYAEKYKHVIEPQLVWSYRSRVDGFDDIPKFDSQDYVPGTNQSSTGFSPSARLGRARRRFPTSSSLGQLRSDTSSRWTPVSMTASSVRLSLPRMVSPATTLQLLRSYVSVPPEGFPLFGTSNTT
jgi:LPS-assembly protein